MSKHLLFTTLAVVFLLARFESHGQCSVIGASDCTVNNPDEIDSNRNYNCHQYVRAALLGDGLVNPINGEPTGSSSSFSDTDIFPTSDIATDSSFVRVCGNRYAEAISFTTSDHSALILGTSSGREYASTPGPDSPLYRHGCATQEAGPLNQNSHNYNFYAVMPQIGGDEARDILGDGSRATYEVENPGFIQSITWSLSNTNYATITSSNNSFSIDIQSSCASATTVNNKFTIEAKVRIVGTNEMITLYKEVTVQCYNLCSGKLNGGQLYTFSSVSSNVNNTVIMNRNGWNWSKTSGSTNYWYTRNGGKEFYFSIPSGCASFTAIRSGCGTLNFTFCGYGGYYSIVADGTSNGQVGSNDDGRLEEPTDITPFTVYDLSGRLVREDFLGNYVDPMEGLLPGIYILSIYETQQKIMIE